MSTGTSGTLFAHRSLGVQAGDGPPAGRQIPSLRQVKKPWHGHGERNLFSLKLGFHTYRHSFASNLAAAGVDQRIIDEWMGHQTEAMRKRYRHLFPSNRRQAIESFSLLSSVDIRS